MADLHVACNVETLPQAGTHWNQFLDKVNIGSRTVEDTINKWKAKRAPELWAKTATVPLLAHCFCATVLRMDGEHEPELFISLVEREVCQWLEGWIVAQKAEMRPTDKIVWHTFNGVEFDHPILRLRAIKYKLPNLMRENECYRFGDATHIDWRLKLGKQGALDDVATFLDLHHPNPIDGSQIRVAWERGDVASIQLHTKSRVLILRDIRNILQDVELAELPDEEEAA